MNITLATFNCACSDCFIRKHLSKLKYMLMCIKESCRVFAPVPMISRSLDKTYEIDGHLVPEGIQTQLQQVLSILTPVIEGL